MAGKKKVGGVDAYTAKWVDSGRWGWRVEGGMGTEALDPE